MDSTNRTQELLRRLRRAPLNYKLAAVDYHWARKAELAVQEADDRYRQGDVAGAVARMMELLAAATTAQAALRQSDSAFSRLAVGWMQTHVVAALYRSDVWTGFLWDDQAAEFQPLREACRDYGMAVDW